MDWSHPPMRTLLAIPLLAVAWPSSALATGSLTISLQDDRSRAVEGTVTARPDAGGQAQSCTTRGGRCSIPGLRAGRHQVSAVLIRGGIVPATSVTVVDGRSASVRLTALPPPAAAGPVQQQSQPSGGGGGGGGGAQQVPIVPQGGTRPGGAGGVTVRPGGGVVQGAVTPGARPGQVRPAGPVPIVVQPGNPAAQPAGQGGQAQAAGTAVQTSTRNLGLGQRASILGTTQDQRGRRVEGTVTVMQAGRTVGSVSTTGGSFTAFDLAAGQYSVSFTALSGQQASRNVTVGGGAAVSVRLSITR